MTRVAIEPGLAQRLLEELIYRRVVDQIDLVELTMFERELEDNLDDLLDELGGGTTAGGDAPARVLAGALVERAWQRAERDWRELREDGLDPDWCPLCETLGHDDDHVEHEGRRSRAS